jgi:peroxiredoxin Q/BCP
MGLEVGANAADFSLQASDGNTYTLSQFIGEKPVVIAFFPKAFTGG